MSENRSGTQVLAGCTIAITADRRSRELAGALERRGASVEHAPALRVVPHLDDESLVEVTRTVIADPPDLVVATTGIGFRGWVEAADAAGLADELLDVLQDARLIARGPKARGSIEAAGLTADWVATSETAAEIKDFLLAEGVAGKRIAVQHHGSGSDGLDEAFAGAGAEVLSLVVYRWGPADAEVLARSVSRTAEGALDAVVFTSAPGASAWLGCATDDELIGIRRRNLEGSLLLATVGPVTAGPLAAHGMSPLVPMRWRLGAVVREIVGHYAAQPFLATVAGPLSVRARGAVLDGSALTLTPAGHAILSELVAARGAVVPKEHLLTLLPGGSRDAHALEAAIARLRDTCGSRDLVRTVVKRGYSLALAS
ncbi:uroporphyrinogen-III synthase [Phycicoccus sp. CSK15P-2]|uniref:uroporphyrinogen-III synthase n=1 Tax=Phycicoccus sp. CSK15P-2 TaxID=2807627 RepID=UPI00194FB68C|nr:uroporphyrinogen-III synthase [Phycicoccus sp. CSK15P-2]MBM6404983.1 uroporphyrinogen-III synthase [Phycicoccus sp. CSK15P-2]